MVKEIKVCKLIEILPHRYDNSKQSKASQLKITLYNYEGTDYKV